MGGLEPAPGPSAPERTDLAVVREVELSRLSTILCDADGYLLPVRGAGLRGLDRGAESAHAPSSGDRSATTVVLERGGQQPLDSYFPV